MNIQNELIANQQNVFTSVAGGNPMYIAWRHETELEFERFKILLADGILFRPVEGSLLDAFLIENSCKPPPGLREGTTGDYVRKFLCKPNYCWTNKFDQMVSMHSGPTGAPASGMSS